MNPHEDNLYIKSVIESNNPFFIGRIAGCELLTAYNFLTQDKYELRANLKELENNAGIKCKTETSLKNYVSRLLTAYDNSTVIAEWNTEGMVFAHTGIGQKLVRTRTFHIPKIDALALEPYYYEDSWMSALKNKRILIVHPFIETFQKQYTKFDKLFPNREWFEGCECQFIKPPVTFAGNHDDKDWEEHYTTFIEQFKGLKDFDIALVAAGGYGMLISDFIYKEMGKSVIYVGGALQLFFGVIGKRWFDNKDILKLVNDDWIRPDKKDIPNNYIKVEKGCYW